MMRRSIALAGLAACLLTGCGGPIMQAHGTIVTVDTFDGYISVAYVYEGHRYVEDATQGFSIDAKTLYHAYDGEPVLVYAQGNVIQGVILKGE